MLAGRCGGEGRVIAAQTEHLLHIVLGIGDGHVGDLAGIVVLGSIDGVDEAAVGRYVKL